KHHKNLLQIQTMATTLIYPLSLHDALPILMLALNFSIDNLSLMAITIAVGFVVDDAIVMVEVIWRRIEEGEKPFAAALAGSGEIDRKSTRLNSSHLVISYAVFCLKEKTIDF